MAEDRLPTEDREDCEIIGHRISNELGTRAGDLVAGLADTTGRQQEEALWSARAFVAKLRDEFDRAEVGAVPFEVLNKLDTLDRRVEDIALARELADSTSELPSPKDTEPPRIEVDGPELQRSTSDVLAPSLHTTTAPPAPTILPPIGGTHLTGATGTRTPPILQVPSTRRAPNLVDQRRTGLLLGTGIAALATGTGAVAGGVSWWSASYQRVRSAQRIVSKTGPDDGGLNAEAISALQDAEREHVDATRSSVVLVSLGAGAMAAGIALTTIGGIRMKARRNQRHSESHDLPHWSVTPSVDRAGTGLVLHARF
ncbi:MAG: hypothetical protein KC501_02815 [Myxococcales bacterium]|nr:hypothetical protein [Myxococcales bacterium]